MVLTEGCLQPASEVQPDVATEEEKVCAQTEAVAWQVIVA